MVTGYLERPEKEWVPGWPERALADGRWRGGTLRFCCYFVPSSHRCHPSEGAQVGTVSGLFRPRENLCLYGSLNTNTMPRPTRNEANHINVPVVHFPSFRWFRRIANEMDDPRVLYKQSAKFSNTRRSGNHFNRSCTFATVYCVTRLFGTEHKVSHCPRDSHSNLPL